MKLLRKLAEFQQFPELLELATQEFAETGNARVLPFLVLAQVGVWDFVSAGSNLERAERSSLKWSDESLLDLAAAQITLFESDKAQRTLQNLATDTQRLGPALALRAICSARVGDLTAATQFAERAVLSSPDNFQFHFELAHLYRQQKEFVLAQRVVKNLTELLETLHNELPDFVVSRYIGQIRCLQLACWVGTSENQQAESWLNEKRKEGVEPEAMAALTAEYATLLAENGQHELAEERLRDALRSQPDSIALHRQLIELLLLIGRPNQAVHVAKRAIRLVEGDGWREAHLCLVLGSALLLSAKSESRKYANRAWQLVSSDVDEANRNPAAFSELRLRISNLLARLENQDGNFAEAESAFVEILKENPFFLPTLQAFGQQQLQLGNIDEAVGLFERIRAIDPASGASALISARHFPTEKKHIESLQEAACRPSFEGPIRTGLLFQVAAAWEKSGDYERAIECVKKANEASRNLMRYDARGHRNYCARIRARFSRDLYRYRENYGSSTDVPVYVCGMPRSGTTLVEQILAGHSEIFGAGELGVIPQAIAGLNRWELHAGSGRKYPDCVDDLNQYVTEKIARNVLQELQELAPSAKRIVDKLPHNFENIGLIKFLFPKAKIISVRRDPRDIAVSNYFTDYQAKHGGMGFAYDLGDIGEQLADHNLLMRHWEEVFPGEILEVNYEDVVADAECCARRMLEYLGVGWEPEVLNFSELDRPVKTASVWQVRQPIYRTSQAKWRNYQRHLEPLIRGTNAKIRPEPIQDMLSLPEPGFLTSGVELFQQQDFDGAELNFKKMLHHNPNHAACKYMLGLVYLNKGRTKDGILLIEEALRVAPWHREWRENLAKAYESIGDFEKLEWLKSNRWKKSQKESVEEIKTALQSTKASIPEQART